MKIVTGPKGSGKTDDLLIWLLEGHRDGKNRILITLGKDRQTALTMKLQELWVESGHQKYINNAANSIYTVTYMHTNSHRIFRGQQVEVGIVDADEMLQNLLHINQLLSIGTVTDPHPSMPDTENKPLF